MADQMFQRTLVSLCFEVFHGYLKITLHPNFIISHLSLFFLSLFVFSDTMHKIAPVKEMDLNNVLPSGYYDNKSNFGCIPEFVELALLLMLAHNLMFPINIEEATIIFIIFWASLMFYQFTFTTRETMRDYYL